MDEKDFKQAMKWYRRAPVTRVAPETGSLSAQPKKDISQREKARVWFPRELPACSSQTEMDGKYEENLEDNHSALTIYREKHVTPHSKTEKVEDAEAFNAPEIPLAETMSEDNPPYDVDYRTIRDDGLLLEMSDDHVSQDEIQADKTDSFSGVLASIETGLESMLAEKPKLQHPSKSFSSIETCLAGILEEDSADSNTSESDEQKDIDPEIAAELARLSEEELAEIAGFDLSLLRKDDDDNEPQLSHQEVTTELGKEELAEMADFDLSLSAENQNDAEDEEDKAIVSEKTEESLSKEEVDVSKEAFVASEIQSAIEVESETLLSKAVDTEMALKTSTEAISELETISETDLPKPEESLFDAIKDEEEPTDQTVLDTSRLNRFVDSGEGLIIHNLSEDQETVSEASFADTITEEDNEISSDLAEDFIKEDISPETTNFFEESDKTELISNELDLLSTSDEIIEEAPIEEGLPEESIREETPLDIEDESSLSDEMLATPIELSSDIAVEEEISSEEIELDEIIATEQRIEKASQTDDEQLVDISQADEITESDGIISDETLSLKEYSEILSEEMVSAEDTDIEALSDFKDDLSLSQTEKSDISSVADVISEIDEPANLEVTSEEVNQVAVEPELLTEKVVKGTDALLVTETVFADDADTLQETATMDDSVSKTETEFESEIEVEKVSQDETSQEFTMVVSRDEAFESEVALSEEILSVESIQSTVVSDQSTESDKADEEKDLQAKEMLDDVDTLMESSDQADQTSKNIPVLATVSEEDAISEKIESAEFTATPDPENALADSILLAEGENPPDFDVPIVPVLDETTERTQAPIPEEDAFREKIRGHQRNKMAFAEYKVAVAYARKNTDEARREMVKWYTRAAENGHAVSQFNLGNIYYAGRGVDKDYELAADWYEMAARQGVARAQDNLGLMYFHGRGRFVDTELAVYWFHQAALQGYAPAQYKLAMHLEAGVGIEADLQEAMYWYQRAASQGDIKAQKALSRLEGNSDQ